MPEVSRGVRSGKILTLSMDEGVFGKLKNRLGMISGKNIKRMRLRLKYLLWATSLSWTAREQAVLNQDL